MLRTSMETICYEYVVTFREKYKLLHKERASRIQVGDVVIIKAEGTNQRK